MSTDKDVCGICRDNMSVINLTTLTCNHSFHSDCIDEWIDRSTSCPYCRKKVLVKEEPVDHPIFLCDPETFYAFRKFVCVILVLVTLIVIILIIHILMYQRPRK